MKNLLKILACGAAAFMILAIAQEWTLFRDAWFGSQQTGPKMSESEQKEAADAIYQMLALMEHLYATAGDSRFAERMPASESVVEEMMQDIEYLRRNHRIQELLLDRLEILAIEELGKDRVEIWTQEFWNIRFLWLVGGREAEPRRPHRFNGKYLLSRGTKGWRVEGWDLAETE